VSVEVKIPTVLRKHTNNEPVVDANGATIRELIEDIASRFPEFREKVVSDDGNLHRFINVYANDEDVRYLDGLETKVADGDTVAILPAVAGGGSGGCNAPGRGERAGARKSR
jgi:sulfur-carrier protein